MKERTNFLHTAIEIHDTSDEVVVTLDKPANVSILTPEHFANYKAGEAFKYVGGYSTVSPYRAHVEPGNYHVVIDLEGQPEGATVTAGVKVVRAPAKAEGGKRGKR